MSRSSSRIVNLNDVSDLNSLQKEINMLENISDDLRRPIVNALDIIVSYDKEADLSVYQINTIYKMINLNHKMSPLEMDQNLNNTNNNVAIIASKFINEEISEKEIENILIDIIKGFEQIIINGNILLAIRNLISSFSKLCLTSVQAKKRFKETCFQFYESNTRTSDVIVLVVNIDYGKVESKFNFFNVFHISKRNINFSFFGAVIKTEKPICKNSVEYEVPDLNIGPETVEIY